MEIRHKVLFSNCLSIIIDYLQEVFWSINRFLPKQHPKVCFKKIVRLNFKFVEFDANADVFSNKSTYFKTLLVTMTQHEAQQLLERLDEL